MKGARTAADERSHDRGGHGRRGGAGRHGRPPAVGPSLLGARTSGVGLAPLRTAVTVALQRTVGNQAVGGLVVQRTVKESEAVSALRSLLEDHKQEAWYQSNWPAGVKTVARAIAELQDTDKDNLKKRLRAHPTITPLLKPERMKVEHAKELPELDKSLRSQQLQNVYEAYERLLFYHATQSSAEVRATGSLDPSFGGGDTGYSNTRSLAGQKAANVAASKRKIFVSRKISEARQYAAESGSRAILRVLIPTSQQAGLKVDPDSQFGLYIEEELKGLDTPDRRLNHWGYSYLQQEIKDTGTLEEFPSLYAQLVKMGMFLPGVEEAPVDISRFVVSDVLPEEEIQRRLKALSEK
jgi:hypothetical protein